MDFINGQVTVIKKKKKIATNKTKCGFIVWKVKKCILFHSQRYVCQKICKWPFTVYDYKMCAFELSEELKM